MIPFSGLVVIRPTEVMAPSLDSYDGALLRPTAQEVADLRAGKNVLFQVFLPLPVADTELNRIYLAEQLKRDVIALRRKVHIDMAVIRVIRRQPGTEGFRVYALYLVNHIASGRACGATPFIMAIRREFYRLQAEAEAAAE